MCEKTYINWKTDNDLAVKIRDKVTGLVIELEDCEKIELSLGYKDGKRAVKTYSTEDGTLNIIGNKAVVYITIEDSKLFNPLEDVYFIASAWTEDINYPDGVKKRSSDQVYILTYKDLG